MATLTINIPDPIAASESHKISNFDFFVEFCGPQLDARLVQPGELLKTLEERESKQ